MNYGINICWGPTNLKPVTAVYLSDVCDRSGASVCYIDKVIFCDLDPTLYCSQTLAK